MIQKKQTSFFSPDQVHTISESFSLFSDKKVLVVGDVMLDLYTKGKIKRISPEAPVPVFHVQEEEYKLGGAANAAINILALGAKVTLLSRVGQDPFAAVFLEELEKQNISSHAIFKEEGFKTPLKNRILADNQQVIRIDREEVKDLSASLEKTLIENIKEWLKGIDLVAISDYGKGFLSTAFLAALIQEAKAQDIPVFVDPKGADFTKYLGVDVIKPNLGELYLAANLPHTAPIEEAAKKVLFLSQAKLLMVTRSEHGISLFYPEGEHKVFKAEVRKVKDVTGAGDTVLALSAVALAAGLPHEEMAGLANVAAGIAIEEVGCAVVSLSDLVERFLSIHVEGKLFKKEHVGALAQILKGKDIYLISVEDKEAFDVHVYEMIENFEIKEEAVLLLSVPPSWQESSLNMATLLPKVDYLIQGVETISSLAKILHLEKVFAFEENQLEPLLTIHELFMDDASLPVPFA